MKNTGRRAVIVGTLGISTGAAGYILGGGSLPTPSAALNTDIDSTSWERTTLTITFASDAEADGFAIIHQNDETIEESIYSSEIPDGGGAVNINFNNHIADWGNYTPHKFTIQLYAGQFSGDSVSLAEEKLSSISVKLPEDTITGSTTVSG